MQEVIPPGFLSWLAVSAFWRPCPSSLLILWPFSQEELKKWLELIFWRSLICPSWSIIYLTSTSQEWFLDMTFLHSYSFLMCHYGLLDPLFHIMDTHIWLPRISWILISDFQGLQWCGPVGPGLSDHVVIPISLLPLELACWDVSCAIVSPFFSDITFSAVCLVTSFKQRVLVVTTNDMVLQQKRKPQYNEQYNKTQFTMEYLRLHIFCSSL